VKQRLFALMTFVALGAVSGAPVGGAEPLFTVDERVTPIRRELPPLEDGLPRLVAALADAAGSQQEFVEDEVLVATDNPELLGAFLARWQGKVLETHAAKEKGGVTRHLVRINPDLAKLDDLERFAATTKLAARARYRASSGRGLRLLAAVAREKNGSKKPGDSDQAADYMDVEANWLPYRDTTGLKVRDQFAWLDKTLAINCGYPNDTWLPFLGSHTRGDRIRVRVISSRARTIPCST
jgi:hypothetical protein